MKDKGFTLIELLVVVAIIGILATVVLASLGSARTRSRDASIRATLTGMRAQAELQYLIDGNYNNICDPTTQSGKMFASAHALSLVLTANNLNLCADQDGYFAANAGTTLPTTEVVSGYNGTDSNGTIWMAEVQLNSGGWFCVDSNGVANNVSTISRVGSPMDKTCNPSS